MIKTRYRVPNHFDLPMKIKLNTNSGFEVKSSVYRNYSTFAIFHCKATFVFCSIFRNKTDLEKFLYTHKSKISEVSVKRQGVGGLKIGQKLTT